MEYVLDENGNIKIGPNGQPLVKGADGKEFEVDAIGANEKITKLVTESNDRRKKLGEANTALAEMSNERDTLKTQVDAIDDKNKVKISEITDNINKAWEEKQKTWETEKGALNTQLFNVTTGVKFATSPVAKKLILPADIALATFGKSFRPDGTAVDAAGNTILSMENPGKPAEFDEALTVLIDAYPNKDSIIRSEAGGGGGHTPQGGGGNEGSLTASEKISAGLKSLNS